jgi:SAM-dependent methyltransferase
VIGVDLSAAAEVAARNLVVREFLALQADVFSLPFAPESFDFIYSLGVLHHTPDCAQAFRELPRYLKPGGNLAIWVYSNHNPWYRFSDQYRKVTHRLRPETLHRIVRRAVPALHSTKKMIGSVPLVGRPLAGAVQYVFPISQDSDPEMRILDTFDWYSPRYQSKHSCAEVRHWFEQCGLEAVESLPVKVAVRGRKPAHPADRVQTEMEFSATQAVEYDRKL